MMQNFLSSIKNADELKAIHKSILVIYKEKHLVVVQRHTISIADAISGLKLIKIKGM